MLITKLVAYARANNLVDDPLFELKPVNFLLTFGAGGQFISITALGDAKRGLPSRVPKKVGGNAGGVATFGTDNARFVLGISDGNSEPVEKSRRDHEAFKALVSEARDECAQNPAFDAAAAFFANPEQVAMARAEAIAKGIKGASRVAIAFSEDFGRQLADTPDGQAFWRAYQARRNAAKPIGEAVMCLSCGEIQPAVRTNDTKIMGLIGGQPSGTALVSFDKDAFQSFDWDKNANAAVCEPCSQAYTRALNHLLIRDNTPRTQFTESGVSYVIWSDVPGVGSAVLHRIEEPQDADLQEISWEMLDEPGPEPSPDVDVAIATLDSPRTGKRQSRDPGRLYVLGLRGNGGRAVVVDWFDVTLAEAKANVDRWFEDLQIQLIFDQAIVNPKTKERTTLRHGGQVSSPVSRWMLGKSTVREGEDVPKHVSAALIRAALEGKPIPLTTVNGALDRLRIDGFGDYFAPARIGLLRCALNRLFPEERRLEPMLDPNNTDPAYVCGRLLSVLENVQYQGVGDVGATVVDRFFGRASTSPHLVFGQLLTLAENHLSAIDNQGTRTSLERELQEVIGLLGNEFPKTLSVEQQGRFAIGFWHQKADRFARIRANREANAAAATSTTTPGSN